MLKNFLRSLQIAALVISASFFSLIGAQAQGGWYVFINPELNPGIIDSTLHVRAVAKPGPLPTAVEEYNRIPSLRSLRVFESLAALDWLRTHNIPTQGVKRLWYRERAIGGAAWEGARHMFPFWVSSTAPTVVEADRNLQYCLLALNLGVPVVCPEELTFRPRAVAPGLFYEATAPSPTYRWQSIDINIDGFGHPTHIHFEGKTLNAGTVEFTHLTEGLLDVAIWGESYKVTTAKYSALSRQYLPESTLSALESTTRFQTSAPPPAEKGAPSIAERAGKEVAVRLGTTLLGKVTGLR